MQAGGFCGILSGARAWHQPSQRAMPCTCIHLRGDAFIGVRVQAVRLKPRPLAAVRLVSAAAPKAPSPAWRWGGVAIG